jgi:ketosteroid isomerase-like protein
MLIMGHSAIMSEFEHMIATFALSDFSFLDVVIDGDKAAVRWRATVRLISTGQAFSTEFAHFLRFEAGKVVSMIGFVDTALTRQILSGNA